MTVLVNEPIATVNGTLPLLGLVLIDQRWDCGTSLQRLSWNCLHKALMELCVRVILGTQESLVDTRVDNLSDGDGGICEQVKNRD